MEKDWIWIGKKVYLTTKSGRVFSGVVLDENDEILIIKDKFSMNVQLPKSNLNLIQEER